MTEFAYEEKMLYLILNSDETFELRWVDYYSIRYVSSTKEIVFM